MKLFVSALIASKSASAEVPAGLTACLSNDAADGCHVVDVEAQFDGDGNGSFESPHPYMNNMNYIFKIRGSGVLEYSFDEFEVDLLDDGSCGDEVWIFKGNNAPLGPFCGFDDAFHNADSINYDYYYDNLLNTVPEALKGNLYSFNNEITIGLKSRALVYNYGFKISYRQVDCQPGYAFDAVTQECTAQFETPGAYPSNLVCPGPDCSGDNNSMLRMSSGGLASETGWNFLAKVSVNGPDELSSPECTGVILDSETILTAGTCCNDSGNPEALIGNYNSNAAEAGEFSATVTSVHRHESENLCVLKVENMDNAEDPSVFSTVCLPEVPMGIGRACWSAGWGATSVNGAPSAKLREVGLNIFDRDYCVAHSKPSTFRSFSLAQGEFCAGTPDHDEDGFTDEGPSPCTHDQGAPLVCDDNGAPVMYGTFSRQIGCSKKGQPSVFSDIYANRLWIKSHMAEICPTEPPVEPTFEPLTNEQLPGGLVCDAERIASGALTGDELQRWKFLVNVQRKNNPDSVACGGTVVNGCHVLTSAQCCWNFDTGRAREANQLVVGFGDYNAGSSDAGEFRADVYSLTVHPEFDPDSKLHDLCVLQFYPLADQTSDASVLASACLPADHDVDMRTCWTAGWGENKPAGSNAPLKTPREAPLNVFPHDYCLAKTETEVLKYDQFCAGIPDADDNGQTDVGYGPCDFDEGNPLICPVDGKPVLYGVTSQVNCGKKNSASIFTKTTSAWNKDWISDTIGQECPAPGGECLYPAFTGVPVTWIGGKQTRILYKTNDAVMARVNIPQWRFDFNIRENPYLIFAIFQRQHCGKGFFDVFNDEDTYKQIMDSDDHYELQYSYEKVDDRYSSLTMQIRMHTVGAEDLPFWKGSKATKKDQLFLFVGGLANVDWKGNDRDKCFEKMVIGAMEMPSDVGDPQGNFDYTPCVGEEKLVGF